MLAVLIVLRIATLAPPGSAWEKALTHAGNEIASKTSSRVTIQWYPGGAGADELDYIKRIKAGQLDGAELTSVGLSTIDPSIALLELPRMFGSIEEYDYVSAKLWPWLQRTYAGNGFALLAHEDAGAWTWFSVAPIQSIGDLQSSLPWARKGEPIVAAFYGQLGVTALPMEPSNVYGALSVGTINACYGSPLALIALRWSTSVKFELQTAIGYRAGALALDTSALGQISASDEKIVLREMNRASAKIRSSVRKEQLDADRALGKAGIKLVALDPTFGSMLDAAGAATWTSLAGTLYTTNDLAMVLKYRGQYRQRHAQAAASSPRQSTGGGSGSGSGSSTP
ncbi:MAG TPA: TRAP transporter substrate-binding protein DctP [Kofleriaceae bacterium]|nr:TRAP transporter substrate-binding protein DctP [Kofleriaceae bacterium]